MASKNGWLWSVGIGAALGPESWLRSRRASRPKPAPAASQTAADHKEAGPKDAGQDDAGQMVYHGNEKSLSFHRPGCRYYDCPDCTASFNSREEALAAGYEPCKVCKP